MKWLQNVNNNNNTKKFYVPSDHLMDYNINYSI